MPSSTPYQQIDFSGGLQSATSRFLRKKNEVSASKNAVFNVKIGSATRRLGYEQLGRTIQHGNEGYGLHIYKYGQSNKVLVGINNSGDTSGTVQVLDTNDYWSTIISDAPFNTRFSFLNFLDECYVAGWSKALDQRLTLQNIDSTLVRSTTRNVQFAPKARFIDEFQNGIIAMNVEVGGVKYPDRFYLSSPAIGFITRVQGEQIGLLQQLKVDSTRYLKAGMVVDIYKSGTEARLVNGLTIISIDKEQEKITFAPTQLNLPDNAEIWSSGRKGKLSLFWNTDYPTPESSDWKSIPSAVGQNPEITAHGKNNNRKLLFTRDSAWKFDGANLVNVSETVGCSSPETVKNIGGWTLWLHAATGVWGYNDSSGQLKLLSRSVDNYIKAINQATIDRASAVVAGRIYKLGVGEIADLDSSTTSTSTSSTSTSSTSSSTSSTSTSSTSTSSTSSSTSTGTTTSTSSTSSSTSSTSLSTSSTSTSSTSSSTSMSTSSTTTTTTASTKKVVRLVYDFDANVWAVEEHKREFRYQTMHSMNGYTKPYFQDETGRVWRDETANLDGVDIIPFSVQTGRNNLGVPLNKEFHGMVVHSEKARGSLIMVSIDGQQFQEVGQITQDVQEIRLAPGKFVSHDIDIKVTHNDEGDTPSIDGFTHYYNVKDRNLG
jgi:hypothetical protein